MYCKNCGKKIEDDSRFCPFCGAPVHREEKSLIAKAKAGDNEAIKQLMDQYRGMVRYQASVFVKNEDDVNEIEQQVFIKAFSKISDLADEKKFGGWLKTIAVNTAKNSIKASVTSIQQRDGISLLGLTPLTFFLWLLGIERKAPVEPPVVGKTVKVTKTEPAKKDKLNYGNNYSETSASFECFVNGMIKLQDENKNIHLWKYDKQDYVSDESFDNATFYEDGYIGIKKKGKWAFMDENGKLVTDYIFDKVSGLYNGKAYVTYKGKVGIIDLKKTLLR